MCRGNGNGKAIMEERTNTNTSKTTYTTTNKAKKEGILRAACEGVESLVCTSSGRKRLAREHVVAAQSGAAAHAAEGLVFGGYVTACLERNRKLNRYTDVLPYEDTRVVLSNASKYINASHVVPGYRPRHEGLVRFIATQGPLQTTVGDFWQMCYEMKAPRIVMLTQVSETAMAGSKCYAYFPVKNRHEQTVECRDEGLRVWMEEEEEHEEDDAMIVSRKIVLEKTSTSCTNDGNGDRNEPAEVSETRMRLEHLHFTGWPDHGVPSSTTDFLRLLFEAQLVPRSPDDFDTYMAGVNASSGPVVVHCSAGIGRTGTLCCVVMMLQEVLASGEFDESLPRITLEHLRTQRPRMVERPEQYIFAVLALRDLLRIYLHQCR